MRKQFLSLVVATLLVAAIASFAPLQVFAQEEPKPETTFEEFSEAISAEVAEAVENIVKSDPELSSSINVTVTEVEADLEVKPEVDAAIATVNTEVANTPEPSDVIVTLGENTTTVEVLDSLSNVTETGVIEEVIFTEIGAEVLTNNPELTTEVTNIMCIAFVEAVTNGTDVSVAIESAQDDIAVVIEEGITLEDVQEAEAMVDANVTVSTIVSGEANVEIAVEAEVVDIIEDPIVVPEPEQEPESEPEPVGGSDNGGDGANDGGHGEIIALLEKNNTLIEQQNALLEQLIALQSTNSTG